MGDSEAELALILKARNLASGEVDKVGASLDKAGGKAGGLGSKLKSLGGTALKVGAVGFAALAAGIAFATDKAADEQIGVERMNAAIAASDRTHKVSIATIKKVIAQREALAFADDELRDSFTVLVRRTHDSDAALRLQATAMDLARLKGIPLADATNLLTKGMAGSSKVLADLGIQLPKTATEQERLTAIQAVAAGQAEKYGKTAKGAQESFQIAMGDLVEDAGSLFLPMMQSIFAILREKVIPAVRSIAAAIGKWLDENKPLVDNVKAFVGGALKTFFTLLGNVAGAIGQVVDAISNNKDAMNFLKGVIGLIARGFELASDAIGWVIEKIRSLIGWVKDAIDWLKRLNLVTPRTAEEDRRHKLGLPASGHAAGGWVGLRGPELAVLGEKGPEFVVPNHELRRPSGGGGGDLTVTVRGVSRRELARIIDEELYVQLMRAAPTLGRV